MTPHFTVLEQAQNPKVLFTVLLRCNIMELRRSDFNSIQGPSRCFCARIHIILNEISWQLAGGGGYHCGRIWPQFSGLASQLSTECWEKIL